MLIVATGDVVDGLRMQGKETLWITAHVEVRAWGQGYHT